ncbi:unnamed protein product [Chrysoparadoxa australica]
MLDIKRLINRYRPVLCRLFLLFYLVHPGTCACFASASEYLNTRYAGHQMLALDYSSTSVVNSLIHDSIASQASMREKKKGQDEADKDASNSDQEKERYQPHFFKVNRVWKSFSPSTAPQRPAAPVLRTARRAAEEPPHAAASPKQLRHKSHKSAAAAARVRPRLVTGPSGLARTLNRARKPGMMAFVAPSSPPSGRTRQAIASASSSWASPTATSRSKGGHNGALSMLLGLPSLGGKPRAKNAAADVSATAVGLMEAPVPQPALNRDVMISVNPSAANRVDDSSRRGLMSTVVGACDDAVSHVACLLVTNPLAKMYMGSNKGQSITMRASSRAMHTR